MNSTMQSIIHLQFFSNVLMSVLHLALIIKLRELSSLVPLYASECLSILPKPFRLD